MSGVHSHEILQMCASYPDHGPDHALSRSSEPVPDQPVRPSHDLHVVSVASTRSGVPRFAFPALT